MLCARPPKTWSGEIHTVSVQRRVPLQTSPPSLRTVQVTVVFSPEKFCAATPTAVTTRFAGGVATAVATVRALFVSFDSITYGAIGSVASATTVTYEPRAAGERTNVFVCV